MSAACAPARVLRMRAPTGFTPQLVAFLEDHVAVVCACLVDELGECVDDAARVSADESALIGAGWSALRSVFEAHATILGGRVLCCTLETTRFAFALRRVSSELVLVVATWPDAIDEPLLSALNALGDRLRIEAGGSIAPSAPRGDTLEVVTRGSSRWGYAPAVYRVGSGPERGVVVLGRWLEHDDRGAEIVCFRAQAANEDLTLCHDVARGRWFVR